MVVVIYVFNAMNTGKLRHINTCFTVSLNVSGTNAETSSANYIYETLINTLHKLTNLA
jgi:hypothetical protein